MAARGSAEERAALARAKERLDRLDFHPRPVRTARTRIWHVPWLFRAPWFRRFHAPSSGILVPSHGMFGILAQHGFQPLKAWSHGVDLGLFQRFRCPGGL